MLDPHPVEGAVDEEYRYQKEYKRERQAERRPLLACQRYRELHGKQAEKRGELDNRIQRHRGCVLKWIAHCVANDCCVMKRGALAFQLGLDNLVRVIPSAARICHEDGLVEPEQRDGDQISDEEVWIEKRE